MNFRQPPSKFKNQILTAQKRDQFHSELDLIKDAIGNDSTRTVQANADTIIFSCGHSGVGFVPVKQPGKFGFAHQKVSCGHVSDLHISPFINDRLLAVSCTDQSIRIYNIPNVEKLEEVSSALHEVRASSGTANTPVIVCWNPQVSGILAIASGVKLDVFSMSTGQIEKTIEVPSPIITMDWSHDGTKILSISKDSTLRVTDSRESKQLHEIRLSGTKQVIKSLPENMWVVSSLSRMRERELNLYDISAPGDSKKSWSFGVSATPLIPIPDKMRKIVYLLDKSGGTLRWIEMVSPYNEGAASTAVDQSSNACLLHPFGLQIMDGEINRVLIADTKGNTVPVKITIGRKSYVEFHPDIFTPIEVESSINAQAWLEGKNSLAKVAQVEPSLLAAFVKGESLTRGASIPASSTSNGTTTSAAESPKKTVTSEETVNAPMLSQKRASQTATQDQGQKSSEPILSAREQRKWDRENVKSVSAPPSGDSGREVFREDLGARRAEYGAISRKKIEPEVHEQDNVTQSSPQSNSDQISNGAERVGTTQQESIGKGAAPLLVNEDALEQIRSRRVTPAIEAQQDSPEIFAPQPQREVYREDLSSRRAEYGAPTSSQAREVFKENLGERRAEYGSSQKTDHVRSMVSNSKKDPVQAEPSSTSKVENTSTREVFREDLGSRRAEYGAPSSSTAVVAPSSSTSTPVLSGREQRKWDKEASSTSPTKTQDAASTAKSEVPSQPTRTSTAEREVYREDLAARRAEYGAITPTLNEPTTAYKEIRKALGKQNPVPKVSETGATLPYKGDDESSGSAEVLTTESVESLENAYAPPSVTGNGPEKIDMVQHAKPPAPTVEDEPEFSGGTTQAVRQEVQAITPESIKAPATPQATKTKAQGTAAEYRDYTRKYLQGKPQHPRNSYTSLIGLNSSLPNTARMIHTTPKHIAVPLAGPGGRIAIIPSDKTGRLPPLLSGFTGGAQVVDFELDKFKLDRLVSAHVDQCVKVWTIPASLEELEADLDTPDHLLKGMDRILALSLHPLVKDLLMVTTSTKIHLFDISTGRELRSFSTKGVANSCWSLDGDRIAIGRSDKSVAILDARTGNELKSFPSAHSSTRPFRLHFVGPDKLITAGFGRSSTRQLALYDLTSGETLQVHDMDISPSPFALPHFDEMSNILYLIPRGSSNILPFHITRDSIVPLQPYAAADPIMGTAFFAPQDLSTKEVEIARCVRLSTGEITKVGFHIPRPVGDVFHDDIYPENIRDAYIPVQTSEAWLEGQDPESPKTVDLNPNGLKGATASGIGSVGRKSGSTAPRTPVQVRQPEVNKPSELEQMFKKATEEQADGEPENINKNKNTEWD